MPTNEEKIAVLLDIVKDLAESDNTIINLTTVGNANKSFKTETKELTDFLNQDENCYYLKIPGNGVIKVCPRNLMQ